MRLRQFIRSASIVATTRVAAALLVGIVPAPVARAQAAAADSIRGGAKTQRGGEAPPQKTFFTRRDLVLSGAALTGSALVSIFDDRIARWARQPSVQGGESRHDLAEALTVVNETPLTIGAFAVYGIGALTHSETVKDVGLHTTEALVLTVAVAEAIRVPLGRARPRASPDDAYRFDAFAGFSEFDHRSFPSIHAAVAFATAAALTDEIRIRRPGAVRFAAPLLYGAAMVPGLTRIYLDQHWASDIVAGAFTGWLLGDRVVHYAHTHGRSRLDRWLLGAVVVPNGQGGAAALVTVPTPW